MLFGELPTLAQRIAADPPAEPMDRHVAVEVEVQGNPDHICRSLRQSQLAAPVNGYNQSDRNCGYHCTSDACGEYLIHPTSDGTVGGGEYVMGGPVGSPVSDPTFHHILEQALTTMILAGAYIDDACGGHVHVDRQDLNIHQGLMLITSVRQYAPELVHLFSGDRPGGIRRQGGASRAPEDVFTQIRTMRERNLPLSPRGIVGGRGEWIHFTHYGTVEIRGWNGTVTPWRVLMNLYTSAALVEAAHQDRSPEDSPTLLDHIGPFLPGFIKLCIAQQVGFITQGNTVPFAELAEIPGV